MLKPLKLGGKFTLTLGLAFLIGIVVGSLVLWQALYQTSQTNINAKGLLLIDTLTAVRDYTSNHIQPLLKDKIDTGDKFVPESVPAFSAITVFETFRANKDYANFLYRESTLNPTNPRDLADDFEKNIVQQMRTDSTIKETSGFRQWNGSQVYYIARPLKIASATCLTCHSDPSAAPRSQIASYGSTGGFGWQLNEIVGAKFIYVPADEVLNETVRSSLPVIAVFVAISIVTLLTINRLLRRSVIHPIQVVDMLAIKVQEDNLTPDDLNSPQVEKVAARGDELGDLARIFTRMANEVYARTQTLKKQVRELRIEIDQIKSKEQVDEITSTDFFKSLKSRADDLRKKTDRPTSRELDQGQSES